MRVFTWAIKQRGLRVPGRRNPAAAVERYPTRTPEIRFRTLPEIAEQIEALSTHHQLRTMAALIRATLLDRHFQQASFRDAQPRFIASY